MPKRLLLLAAVAAMFGLSTPSRAEEIIYFTNGTTMPIRAHSIKDGMIHVDLGDNGFMAFPYEVVERIDRAGKNVLLKRSSTAGRNQRVDVPDDPAGSYPISGTPMQRRGASGDEDVVITTPGDTDEKGLAVVRPFGRDNGSNKGKFGVVGTSSIFDASPTTHGGEGIIGTRRVGNRHVIDAGQGPQARPRRARTVGVAMRASGDTPPPSESSEGSSPGASGSEGEP
jgi:hypothetical protein